MSDSVDRVFSHALNTVNKIPIGAEKPPAKTRLKLYGLYKQSMEGDVDGIMERPTGYDSAAHQGREKWDAWKSCAGLSRTEAKKRYITTLISTMRQYASSSPDSRALVDELEFVWDQVKSNVSSSSSSPTHNLTGTGLGIGIGIDGSSGKSGRARSQSSDPAQLPLPQSPGASYSPSQPLPSAPPQPVFNVAERSRKRLSGMSTRNNAPGTRTSAELRHLTGSPLSQSVADDSDSNSDAEGDEFVDAPDSQFAEPPPNPAHLDDIPPFSDNQADDRPRQRKRSEKEEEGKDNENREQPSKSKRITDDAKWRRRVSTALIKLTAEVAALREQLEARRLWTASRRGTLFNIAWSLVTAVLKHIAFDLVLLTIVLLWMRRKKDGRLEGAIRVLLGDAVAQVQRVGTGVQREVQKVGRALVVAGAVGRKSNGGH